MIYKFQNSGVMPQIDATRVVTPPEEYKRTTIQQDHDALVKWNLEHPNDKVYRIENLIQKEKEANPSWVKRAANLAVNPVPTSNFGMMSVPNLNSPVRSTVKDELGVAMAAASVPMIGSEIGIYGGLGAVLRFGAGSAAAAGASYIGGKTGDWLDNKLGANWIGDTNRLILPFITFPAGMKGANSVLRSAAGHGITMGMPQETFANLRGQYFNNAASRVTVNSKPNPILNSTIEHLYKEYPELSLIGPKEAYRQYYETIFPASKVQTPYAHGTKSDLSGGLETSVKVPNAAAPETIGRNDFYLNLQPEASLQYADGIGVPKGFTWNKHRFWPLKEILGKPYESDAWMSKPIKLREQVPNRAGQFSRVKNADGTYSGHGKLLEEYKAELGMQDLSNEEFLQRLGVQNEESFNQWVAKNRQMFSDIYDSGDYHGLYHVKIDANKPLTIDGGNTYYSERGIWNRMNKGGNDVLLHNNAANEFGSDVAVVRDVTPQKVRILGSKPDQQGFADFMGGKQQFFTNIPISPQEAATTYHFDGRMPFTKPISFEERLGWTRGERMQPDPKNPIPISLINRSDSYLPIEGDSFVLESPEISKKLASVHFTMNEPVTGHGGGSWDSASTTLIFPYGNIRKVTGPINIEPMDTFFPNYNGLRFKTKGAKVLTGDRAVHDYYTQHGVDSQFSEELEALLKEYKAKAGTAEKYLEEHDWIPDEGYFPLRDAETALSDRIQQIHYNFVDKYATRPSYEDLLKLEKIEGLRTGAEPISYNTMRTPLEDKLGYTWFGAPATHSNLTFYDPGDNISSLPKPMQEFVKWLWEHKADYRKHGGIIKGQGGIGRGLKLNLQNIPQSSNPTAVDNARKINQAGINASVKDNGERYAIGADRSNDYADDPYVAEYFEKDVIPRYMREHPNATKAELDALRRAYHYPQKSGELNPSYGGVTSYNGGTPTITYNESRGDPYRTTVVHENTHAYRYGIDKVRPSYNYGFNSKEEELLNEAYSMDNYSNTINSVAEMGATNAEIRYVYWKKLYDTLGRVPTLEEMDNYINSLPLGTLERVERGVNNYGKHSVNEQRDDRSNMFIAPGQQRVSDMERRKRDALIHVADNSEQTDMSNLAKEGCKLRFTNKLHK